MTGTAAPVRDGQLTIVPASEASREDAATICGTTDDPGLCRCQGDLQVAGRIRRDSSGLVAYVDGEPAGSVAVESRIAHPR